VPDDDNSEFPNSPAVEYPNRRGNNNDEEIKWDPDEEFENSHININSSNVNCVNNPNKTHVTSISRTLPLS